MRIGRTTESRWETTPTRLGARTRRWWWWWRRRWWDTTFHGRRRRREQRLDTAKTTSTHESRKVTTSIGNFIERSTSDGQWSLHCRHHDDQYDHHHVQRWGSTARHPQFHQGTKLNKNPRMCLSSLILPTSCNHEHKSHLIEWNVRKIRRGTRSSLPPSIGRIVCLLSSTVVVSTSNVLQI